MAAGPRTPSRSGSGPGRGRPRARAASGRAEAAPSPEPAVATAAPDAAGRRPNSLTARAIACAVVLLILTISYASSLRIYFAQAHDIAATQAEIADRQAKIVELSRELGRWQDDEYVKTQARQRLGWVVPGETGYRVVGADGRPLGGGAEITSEAEPAPTEPREAWWARLWGSVAAADQPAPLPAEQAAADKPITEDTQPR